MKRVQTVIEIAGFACLTAAAWIAFGLAAGLATAGILLIAAGNVKPKRLE